MNKKEFEKLVKLSWELFLDYFSEHIYNSALCALKELDLSDDRDGNIIHDNLLNVLYDILEKTLFLKN